MTCPECGGGEVRQITPNSYECLGQVLVGMAPPEATGMPHPAPIHRPCGARFQVGSAAPTPSCASCGLDSIGGCEDCGRRLCGRHGTSGGPFLCGDCVRQRQARRAEAEAASARDEAERREGERKELEAILAGSDSPGEVAAALRRQEGLVDRDRCRDAWRRLAPVLGLAPTHDCLEVSGRGSILHPWRETPASRIQAWRAAGVGSYRIPAYGDADGVIKTDVDLFLAADGTHWRSTGLEEEFPRTQITISRRLILPRGAPFQTRRRKGYSQVPGSTQIQTWYAPHMRSEQGVEGEFDYTRAVATILEQAS